MTDVHVSLDALHGGHSAPRTHRCQERFSSHDHHLCLESEMAENVGSLTRSYVDVASLTPISMQCFTRLPRPTVSPSKGGAEASAVVSISQQTLRPHAS